jgi:hypothetical protein
VTVFPDFRYDYLFGGLIGYVIMSPDGLDGDHPDFMQDYSAVQCDDCQSVLESGGEQFMSFLLLDQLTIPVISCDNHLEEFTSICGLTTENTVDLLHHEPAGGIRCPGCRVAPYNPVQPLIPVQGGAIAVSACPDHQLEIVNRFQTGLQTQQRLSSGLDTDTLL